VRPVLHISFFFFYKVQNSIELIIFRLILFHFNTLRTFYLYVHLSLLAHGQTASLGHTSVLTLRHNQVTPCYPVRVWPIDRGHKVTSLPPTMILPKVEPFVTQDGEESFQLALLSFLGLRPSDPHYHRNLFCCCCACLAFAFLIWSKLLAAQLGMSKIPFIKVHRQGLKHAATAVLQITVVLVVLAVALIVLSAVVIFAIVTLPQWFPFAALIITVILQLMIEERYLQNYTLDCRTRLSLFVIVSINASIFLLVMLYMEDYYENVLPSLFPFLFSNKAGAG